MARLIRFSLAVVCGVFVALALVAALEAFGHLIYPPPADLDLSSPEALRAYMQGLPTGALVIVLIAWVIGTFIGALVACLVARNYPERLAAIVGAVVLAATVANLIAIPHPGWFTLVAVLAIPGAAFFAARIFRRRRLNEGEP